MLPPVSPQHSGSGSAGSSGARSPPALPTSPVAPASLPFDAPLADLFGRCTELTALRIHAGSHLVSDLALLAAAESCPLLAHVVIPESPRLTDAGLIALAECPRLKELNVAR